MGTNYYRIPTEVEILQRKETLLQEVQQLGASGREVMSGFGTQDKDSWDMSNPWDRFTEESLIHLGKRSMGWQFLWNFHKNKYYSNREELFEFIKAGRIVDEYGAEMGCEEFISMALNWCPDGHFVGPDYIRKMQETHPNYSLSYSHYDNEIDGLRVCSSTDFS
jgi:hypothetical protein